MATGSTNVAPMDETPPHPYLNQPKLFVSDLPGHITDEVIAKTLEFCVPFRPRLTRDPVTGNATGSIEFRTIERAEKALATLNGRPINIAYPIVTLQLYPSPPEAGPVFWPAPTATTRMVTSLPPSFNDSRLFDTFRGFGAVASCQMQPSMGPDVGLVSFWREEDAIRAEETMHMSELDDNIISVKPFTRREFNPAAPVFVPSYSSHPASPPMHAFSLSPMPSPHHPMPGSVHHSPLLMPGQTLPVMYSPPRVPLQYPRSPTMSPFVHGPGQQVQYAPSSGPGSTSASGLIDPCNLFCKNLDPELDSNQLFAYFRKFGQIVSARVMRTETGQSRGFGFVSYQTPEQATRALQAMNGATILSKQIVVRLHEPKQLRKEKLAQRFALGGHNGHPRSGSGATSPTLSEGGESVSSRWSPGHIDRHRRGSGSYYQAALTGTLHMPMRFEELSTLSPVVRQEVISGELNRRLRSFPEVQEHEIEAVVTQMTTQPLEETCAGLMNSQRLLVQIRTAKEILGLSQPEISTPEAELYTPPAAALLPVPSRSTSVNSSLLDPNTLAATASAPEHPSTPVSFTPSINTPPRTASPAASIAPGTEKERLLAVVTKLEPDSATDITEMLLSLTKKERAMCLFSMDYLRAKVDTAKAILDTLTEDSPQTEADATPQRQGNTIGKAVPATPQPKHRQGATNYSPHTPEAPSASAPSAPIGPSSVHTLATLARLPALEIVKLASSPQSTGLPLPKADPLVIKATDDFVNGILEKPLPQQKQMLGEKLFKTIKAFGVKNAPKVTIAILDAEDLRSVAHLMNSYPSVLKEKVLQLTVPK